MTRNAMYWAITCLIAAAGMLALLPDAGVAGDPSKASSEPSIMYDLASGGGPPPADTCGDVNGSGTLDVLDLIDLVKYVFEGVAMIRPQNADMDRYPGINVSDIAYLSKYLYKSGPEPCDYAQTGVQQTGGEVSLASVDGLYKSTSRVQTGVPITFYLRFRNGSGAGVDLSAITNGFRVYSKPGSKGGRARAVTLDSCAITSSFAASHGLDGGFFFTHHGAGSDADTVGFGGFAASSDGVPDDLNMIAYEITLNPIGSSHVGDSVCIDSAWFPPAGDWVWTTGMQEYTPVWEGPYCFEIVAAPTIEPAFHADVVGGAAPLAVQFTPDCPYDGSTQYRWDFGDNQYHVGWTPPLHNYNSAGWYDVKLRITDAYGADSLTRYGYIRVSETAEADLFASMSMCHFGGISTRPFWYRCSFNNVGTGTAEDCTLKVWLPELVTLDSLLDSDWSVVDPSAYTLLDDTLLTVPLGTLPPGNDWQAFILYGASSATTGDTLQARAEMACSTEDVDLSNNTVHHVQAVADPYAKRSGPGLKTAQPDGVSQVCNIDPAVTKRIVYTLSFKNITDGTIDMLEIHDTLDTDFYTMQGRVEFGSCSHMNACSEPVLVESDAGIYVLRSDCDGLNLLADSVFWYVIGLEHKLDSQSTGELENTAWIKLPNTEPVPAPEDGPVVRRVSTSCCLPPIRGDVDYDNAPDVDVADLVALVDYMFPLSQPGPTLACFEEADVDASGGTIIDIKDLVYLSAYMFEGGDPPMPCP